MAEYASPEMGDALIRLNNQEFIWKNDAEGHSVEDLVKLWADQFKGMSPADDAVNNARRPGVGW